SAEILPWHDLLDRLQRIALGADRLQPALNIEKALLPHDSLPPSAHYRVRSASQIRSDLARGIFRGALEPDVAGGPRPVFDDERATELLREPVGNQASVDIVRAAGRKT